MVDKRVLPTLNACRSELLEVLHRWPTMPGPAPEHPVPIGQGDAIQADRTAPEARLSPALKLALEGYLTVGSEEPELASQRPSQEQHQWLKKHRPELLGGAARASYGTWATYVRKALMKTQGRKRGIRPQASPSMHPPG